MEKKEQIKNIILVFSTIMKSMINPSFKITNPEGGVTQQTIGKCLDLLEADFGDAISRERLDVYKRQRLILFSTCTMSFRKKD